MKKLYALALLVAFALPLTASSVQAQGGVSLIPYVGYNTEDGFGFLVGFGAEFDAPFALGNLVLAIRPSGEYVFVDVDGFSYFQVNGDLVARFGAPGASIEPYAGAGLAVGFLSTDDIDTGFGTIEGVSDTEIGLNLFGGVGFPGALAFGEPFVGARLTLLDGSAFSILGGLIIPLGANS